ncbi:MAG: STAS-like domain-containing protein [Acidobacteriota bacterium]|nr:STAS-like domain-containing protein [Acidobacteriota bacterium]
MSKATVRDAVKVAALAGGFAEDKDIARRIRIERVMPALEGGRSITLDFAGVDFCTQSFLHAMISEALRVYGEQGLGLIQFKSCNPTVKSVVLTVVEYSLDTQKA